MTNSILKISVPLPQVPSASSSTSLPSSTCLTPPPRRIRRIQRPGYLSTPPTRNMPGTPKIIPSMKRKRLNEVCKSVRNKRIAYLRSCPQPDLEYIAGKRTSYKKQLKCTPAETIKLQSLLGLSYNKLKLLKKFIKKKNVDIFPPVEQVMEEKERTYPTDRTETAAKCYSSLQSLCDKTIERSCLLDDISTKLVDGASYICDFKAGSDGMTSDAQYDMKLPDENFDDANVLGTDLVLLQIIDKETMAKVQETVDANSNLNVRPLKFEFAKETEEKIQTDYRNLKKEIKDLKPLEVTLKDNKQVSFVHRIHPSMFDGKSQTAIGKGALDEHHDDGDYNVEMLFNDNRTEYQPEEDIVAVEDVVASNIVLPKTLSSRHCHLCCLYMSKFNDDSIFQEPIKLPQLIENGIAPLHCRIRSMEYFFHAAMKKRAAEDTRDISFKEKLKQAKQAFQKEFVKWLGIRIDYIKQGLQNWSLYRVVRLKCHLFLRSVVRCPTGMTITI